MVSVRYRTINKAFIYLIGLIFVGFNWNDYRIFTEIKLIYDSLILWFISFLPNNPVSYDLQNKVEKDIKDILIKDKAIDDLKSHTNLNKPLEEYKPFLVADKLNEIKSVRKDINETYISDGVDIYTWEEIFSDWRKLLIFSTCILITGTFIIYKFDIDISDWSQWSWTHIKGGFWATLYFLKRLYDWFKRGGPENPPSTPGAVLSQEDRIPNKSPRNVDPLPDERVFIVSSPSTSEIQSVNRYETSKSIEDLAIGAMEAGINPDAVDSDSSSDSTITSETVNKLKDVEKSVRFDISALHRKGKKMEANLDESHPAFLEIEDHFSDALNVVHLNLKNYHDKPRTLDNEKAIYQEYQKLFRLYENYPQIIPLDSIEFSPILLPDNPEDLLKSPVNIEGLSIENFSDND